MDNGCPWEARTFDAASDSGYVGWPVDGRRNGIWVDEWSSMDVADSDDWDEQARTPVAFEPWIHISPSTEHFYPTCDW